MGLIKTAFKTAVAVKTAHVVHDRIQRRKQEQWVAQGNTPESFPGLTGTGGGLVEAAAGLLGGGSPPSPPSPTSPAGAGAPSGQTVDVVAQLRGLAELRAEGLLSDAEFEAQKQRLLAT